MRVSRIVRIAAALCLATGTIAVADHHEGGDMPPMGPPEEMKMVEPMVGEYSVDFTYKMDPMSEEWSEAEATAMISTVAGGGAQQILFDSEMMGMPFTGVGLTSYDRESGKWQTTWVDNMGARISYYTGSFEDGQLVVGGKDMGQGMTFHSRMTTYNITETGFEWKYEMSMDGETYVNTANATYTRK